jgi:flavin reductase (DIM6/NTAB) family NADH-FMN oxidoreductase RutF
LKSLQPQDPTKIKEGIGLALGRVASGVYVLTTEADGQRHGMLATWVAQASFEPPAVMVAFNKERGILNSLGEGGTFTLNVLSNRSTDVFKNFARPAKSAEEDRFAKLELLENPEGAPIFANAVAYLNCRIKRFLDAGDHVIALAEIRNGDIVSDASEPMVHFRRNGFSY